MFLWLVFLLFLFEFMVDYLVIRHDSPSISFFFKRMGVFLESSSGGRLSIGLFVTRDCALIPVLLYLYPLMCQSLTWYYLNNEMAKREIDVKSSELGTWSSSSDDPMGIEEDVTTSKPSTSSLSKPF